MTVCRHGADTGCDLGFAVGELPVDTGVVKVDPQNRIAFGLGMMGQPVFEFPALGMHGHFACEQFQTAGVVIMQVADRHGLEVIDVDPDVV